jgi:3-oxoacid CoA-transferase B subunit
MIKGMGGAMDLVAGVQRIVVVMDHCDKSGGSKFRRQCTLPLTGKGVVDLLITDLGVFEIDRRGAGGATLIELAPEVTLDQIRARTEADFAVAL